MMMDVGYTYPELTCARTQTLRAPENDPAGWEGGSEGVRVIRPFLTSNNENEIFSLSVWFSVLLVVSFVHFLAQMATQVLSSQILDPSQLACRNFIIKHLKELLGKYLIPFPSKLTS